VRPADEIDPEYGKLLRKAVATGVEVLAYAAEFDLEEGTIVLNRRVSLVPGSL
jgi:sugar fermentation stimulation protein A